MDYFYVTGTSRGLGAALTEELLRDSGTTVIGVGRSDGPSHERYRHLTLDVSDLPAVGAFRFDAHPDAGRVVLVNNAATLVLKRVGETDPETIIENFKINVIAPTILMNAFVRAYRDTPAKLVICNITSNAATEAVEAAALYGGPKAALDLITRTIDNEAKAANARRLHAFSINPGSMDTNMQAYLRNFDPTEWERATALKRRYAEGLVLSPATVAAAIARVLREPAIAPGPVFHWTEIPVE